MKSSWISLVDPKAEGDLRLAEEKTEEKTK